MSATKNIHQTRKLMYRQLQKNENKFSFLSNDILILKDMHCNVFILIQWYSGSVQNSFNFHKHVQRRIRVIASNIASRLFQSVQSFQIFLNIFQSVQNFQFPKKFLNIFKAFKFSIYFRIFSERAKFPDINFFTIRAGLL